MEWDSKVLGKSGRSKKQPGWLGAAGKKETKGRDPGRKEAEHDFLSPSGRVNFEDLINLNSVSIYYRYVSSVLDRGVLPQRKTY